MPDSPPSLDDLTFEILKPEDAEGVTSLVQQCYGTHYHYDLFYNPHQMREFLRQGKLHSVVAKTHAGEVVAHMALMREHPNDLSADTLAGMMPPQYRRLGVLSRLGAAMLPLYQQLDLIGLQLYSVTHHPISQRIGIASGAIVCGCLISDSPGTNADGLPIEKRKAIVMQYFPFRPPRTRTLYLPSHYHRLVRDIFYHLDFPALLTPSPSALPEQVSVVESHQNTRRGTAHVRFHALGNDCKAIAQDFLARYNTCAALYVDIPLTSPSAPAFIDICRHLGWFFAGIIFERAATDFLRLQWTLEPFPDDTFVYDEFGKQVVAFVLADRQDVFRSCSLPL